MNAREVLALICVSFLSLTVVSETRSRQMQHDELKQLRDIAKVARQMRSEQKTFFHTRDGSALRRAKLLEVDLDRRLEEHAQGQGSLF